MQLKGQTSTIQDVLKESYEYLFEFRLKPALEVPKFGGIVLLNVTNTVK